MKNYQDQKQIALQVLRETTRIASSRQVIDLVEGLEHEEKHLTAGELYVVICGECKRGKSSLLNAFLEEPDFCPVDAPVATNAITTIRYGDRERIVVHLLDHDASADAEPVIEEISRAQLRDYVTEQGNEGNCRRVQLVEAVLPNVKLREGLVLLDTPGVGTLNVEHTAATYGIIPYADAVLFVGAADEPLTEPELEFCQRIARHTPHLLHVLTKRDAVSNWPEILRDNLHKLAVALQRPEGSVRGVAVSSTLKLDYLEDHDPETAEASGFAELEAGIWELLERRVAILLSRAYAHIVPAISHLRLPIKTERDGLAASSDGELKAIDHQLQEKIRRAQDLVSDSPLWMAELNRRMNLLQGDVTKWVGDEFREIGSRLQKYLERDDYLNDTKKLGGILTADCNGSFAIILKKCEEQLAVIASDLRSETSLDLQDGHATVGAPGSIALPEEIERERMSKLHKASEIGRAATMHSLGLGTTGGLIGGAIGGIIGTFIAPGIGTISGVAIGAQLIGGLAGLIGGIFGLKKGMDTTAKTDRRALRAALDLECRTRLTAAQSNTAHVLTTLLTNVRSDIHQGLLRAITLEQKTCKSAAAALEIARKERSADTTKRLTELGNALTLLQRLETAAADLIKPQAEAEH